ncbi:TPA: hypothetical protein ACN7LM_004024 [Klebsiella pneumoniae]
MTDAELAHTKELAFWMTERVFMNPISAKLLNEDWRKAFPDEVAIAERMKALVEALEKAQAKADVYDMLRDDYGLREKGVGLADFVDWQAKRIAELESRTVKLPPTFWYEHDDLSRDVPVLDKRLVKKMLREAGIKVEAE